MTVKFLAASALAAGMMGGVAFADPSVKSEAGAGLFDQGGLHEDAGNAATGTPTILPQDGTTAVAPMDVDPAPTYSTVPTDTTMQPGAPAPTGADLSADPSNPLVKREAGAAPMDAEFGNEIE